jgi:hypothetical protein
LPLEEVAALFGDEKDVAVFQRESGADVLHAEEEEKGGVRVEDVGAKDGGLRA